jgi:hypothetical protein
MDKNVEGLEEISAGVSHIWPEGMQCFRRANTRDEQLESCKSKVFCEAAIFL